MIVPNEKDAHTRRGRRCRCPRTCCRSRSRSRTAGRARTRRAPTAASRPITWKGELAEDGFARFSFLASHAGAGGRDRLEVDPDLRRRVDVALDRRAGLRQPRRGDHDLQGRPARERGRRGRGGRGGARRHRDRHRRAATNTAARRGRRPRTPTRRSRSSCPSSRSCSPPRPSSCNCAAVPDDQTPAALLALARAAGRGAGRARPRGQPELPLRREVGHARTRPGVNVEILNFDDRVLLHNTSDKDVRSSTTRTTSRTPSSRPTARCWSTRNSKAYYLNEDRQGETAVPQDLAVRAGSGRSCPRAGASSGTTIACTGWARATRRSSRTRAKRP